MFILFNDAKIDRIIVGWEILLVADFISKNRTNCQMMLPPFFV